MGSITNSTTPKGLKCYQARIRRAGYPALIKTFRSYEEAELWIVDNEKRILSGQSVLTKKASTHTIGDALNDYLKSGKALNRNEELRINRLLREFEKIRVSNFTHEHFEKWIEQKKNQKISPPANKKKNHYLYNRAEARTLSDSTIRKFYYTLKKALLWHAKVNGYPFTEVFTFVKPPTTDICRERRLEEGEYEKLLAATDKMHQHKNEYKLVIGFALETSARMQEILLAEWHEINIDKKIWLIPKDKCKTKTARNVPLTTIAIRILDELKKFKKENETRLFYMWKNSASLSHRFKVITTNAEMEDFRFHDLRHEATCRIYERTSLRDIQIAKITGHTDLKTLKRYANLRSENIADEMW